MSWLQSYSSHQGSSAGKWNSGGQGGHGAGPDVGRLRVVGVNVEGGGDITGKLHGIRRGRYVHGFFKISGSHFSYEYIYLHLN